MYVTICGMWVNYGIFKMNIIECSLYASCVRNTGCMDGRCQKRTVYVLKSVCCTDVWFAPLQRETQNFFWLLPTVVGFSVGTVGATTNIQHFCASQMKQPFVSVELWIGRVAGYGETKIRTSRAYRREIARVNLRWGLMHSRVISPFLCGTNCDQFPVPECA